MKKRTRPFVFLFILFSVIGACGFMAFAFGLTEKYQEGCGPPPQEFSESALVGTWIVAHGDFTDTLTIRDDRTYQQIIHSINPKIDYESDWQSWKLEYDESGRPYLYLNGLRLCGYLRESNCNRAGTDGGFWWDFCKEKAIEMPPGGGVLIVGEETFPATGYSILILALPIRYTDAGGWPYILQTH